MRDGHYVETWPADQALLFLHELQGIYEVLTAKEN